MDSTHAVEIVSQWFPSVQAVEFTDQHLIEWKILYIRSEHSPACVFTLAVEESWEEAVETVERNRKTKERA